MRSEMRNEMREVRPTEPAPVKSYTPVREPANHQPRHNTENEDPGR